jgi:CheY-like chemotaxis protein
MTGHLLVVDDAPDIRLLIGSVLAEEGFTVTLATGGQEALELLRLGPRPDAVVLDVQMPDVDGWTVLRTMRATSDDPPPAVMCTVKAGESDRQLADSLGAAAFLTKPFSLGELVAAVHDLVHPAAPPERDHT